MKDGFFLAQTAQFDKSINLFCLLFPTLQFSFSVFFLTTDTIGFHCFYIIYYTYDLEVFVSSFKTNLSWLIYEPIKALKLDLQ